MKAILIDSNNQQIREVSYNGVSDIRIFIGGYLELAYLWANGDTLYVDEHGLTKSPKCFFKLPERSDQPLAGNGLIVGKEYPNSARTRPPIITVDDLRRKITFRKWT